MMLPTQSLLDPDTGAWLLRDANGDMQAALMCWGIALSTFVVLRVPRETLLGCLIVAAATVGLAASVVDMAPPKATASAQEAMWARSGVATSPRGSTPDRVARERPY